MKQVTVVAKAKAKPGKEKDLEAALKAVVPPTHAEPGCLRYIVHRGVEDKSLFSVIERWDNMDSLQSHLQTAHVQALFQAIGGLLDGSPEIVAYETVIENGGPKGSW